MADRESGELYLGRKGLAQLWNRIKSYVTGYAYDKEYIDTKIIQAGDKVLLACSLANTEYSIICEL